METSTESFIESSAPTESLIEPSPKLSTEATALDPIQQLYEQTEGLSIGKTKQTMETQNDKKAKKKAKADKVARLTKLTLKDIIKEAKPLKDIQFEPFMPGNP